MLLNFREGKFVSCDGAKVGVELFCSPTANTVHCSKRIPIIILKLARAMMTRYREYKKVCVGHEIVPLTVTPYI